MPFRILNDAVFVGEESFARWHEGLDRCEIRTQESFPGYAAPGGKELFAQMREYMTAAKKEY